jgi:hypothetical protein
MNPRTVAYLMAAVAGGELWRTGDYRTLDAADPDRCHSDLMQHPVRAGVPRLPPMSVRLFAGLIIPGRPMAGSSRAC